jgi:hypothetical protein
MLTRILATALAISVALVAMPIAATGPGQASVTVGGAAVTIDYGRPSMRGRKIMGGLVPFDKVWRTGANAATSLKTSAAIDIGGASVPAGAYTLYTLPGEKAWTLIINKQTGQWGTQYDQAQDLARVNLKVEALPQPLEQFTITLTSSGAKTGVLTLEWETTRLSVPFSVK